MVTIAPENFRVTREQGFKIQGFGQRQRRKTERMSPGDRLMFYVKDDQVFPLAATITSKAFEDRTPLWHGPPDDELFMYRVQIRADAAPAEDQYIQAGDVAPRLEYLRRWPPELWRLAFQGELHLLPRRDFELLETEMRRVLRRRDGRRGGGRSRGPDPDEGREQDEAPVGADGPSPAGNGSIEAEPAV